MVSYIQVNVTRGEISPYLQARGDLDHYRGGLAIMENWVAMRFGGMTRMPGTVYYGATKHGDRYSRWMAFEFNRDETYAIEVGHQYFRFWTYLGRVETSPGVPYEVAHTYDEEDLPYIQYRQLGDVIYITCEGYPQKTLTRIAETNWSFANYTAIDGPYGPINTTSTTADPAATTGSQTVTFSSTTGINDGAGFSTADIGRRFRFLADNGTWYWGIISNVSSTTEITISFVGTLPNHNASASWRLGSWSNATGFPAAVGIYEDRLGFGGSPLEPLNVWYSVNGDYDNFSVSSPLVDDDALNVRMTGGKLNAVQWLADGRDILVGTEGSLRALGRNDLSGAMSQSNVRQRTESTVPLAYIPPLLIENMVILLDIYRTKIFEAGYTQEVDGYLARELSAVNEHLVSLGIRDWTYQSSPHKLIWMVTDAGTLLAGTYDRDQEVFGISHCTIGGDGYAEAILTLPGVDKDGDQLWLTVRREIDGTVVRYVEYLSSFFREGYTEQDYPIYAHCSGTYGGVETNNLIGLDHLEGQTVGIWADGVDAGDAVVTGGEIIWREELSAELVVFGLRQTSLAQTHRLMFDNGDGQTLGKRVNVSAVLLDLYQTAALFAGSVDGTVYPLRAEEEAEEDPYDPAVLREGSYPVHIDDSWEYNGAVIIRTNSMHPATVRSITTLAEAEP